MPYYNPGKSQLLVITNTLALANFITTIGCSICQCLFFIYYPTTSVYFGNLFPTGLSKHWLLLIHLPCMFSVFVNNITVCVPLTVMLYFGTLFVSFIVREFKHGRISTFYKCSLKFRQTRQLTINYRSVQIILSLYNSLFGNILVPAQGTVTLEVIFTCYFLIRHSDILAFSNLLVMVMWGCVCSGGWLAIIVSGGYLHSHGIKILQSWKRYQWNSNYERKFMKKFEASCTPFAICQGKVYVVKRVSMMVYIRGLSQGLARTLLMLDA